MTDVHTAEQRRRNMQAVRSRDTKPELLLRRTLWNAGLRGYRVNSSLAPGRPDVAYTRWRIAVFVDGCFWHGCPRCYKAPKTNDSFWSAKLEQNTLRDREVNRQLDGAGWTVIRIWEHEVLENPDTVADTVRQALQHARATRRSLQ